MQEAVALWRRRLCGRDNCKRVIPPVVNPLVVAHISAAAKIFYLAGFYFKKIGVQTPADTQPTEGASL